MNLRTRTLAFSAVAAALPLLAARTAEAGACKDLPNPIIVAGSSAIGPFIKLMGKDLAGATPAVTLIYQSQGSCTGVNAIVNDATPSGACAMGACITGTATYYDTSGATQSCDLEAAGSHVDVGVSDVFVESCPGIASRPAGVGDFPGPVEPMTFIVPKASTQVAMTAEEGYFSFGFGPAGMVTPWNDDTYFFIRNQLSGTQQVTARTIGVPAAKMKGKDTGGTSGVLMGLTMSSMPEKSIGIAGTADADGHRDTVTVLALQAYKQKYAYFPDSTPTALDKKNVRDGHYNAWGYLHLVAAVDGMGVPSNPRAKNFIDWVLGNPTTPAVTFDIADVTIAANIVPTCAMSVKRTTELGDLSSYSPAAPCGCYFESKRGGASASCKTCTGDGDCGSGKCRRGYCEAK